MIHINIVCRPVFYFTNGVVTGFIEVSADAILESIFTNIALEYRHPYRNQIKRLIACENAYRLEKGTDPYIKMMNGVVDRNFLSMSMHEAVDHLCKYLRLHEIDTSNMRFRDASSWESLKKFRQYIYNCDKCNTLSETANIHID